VLDEDGAWMDHLPREIERIYSAHSERLRVALAAEGVIFTDRGCPSAFEPSRITSGDRSVRSPRLCRLLSKS
jgi:hypothetical protein